MKEFKKNSLLSEFFWGFWLKYKKEQTVQVLFCSKSAKQDWY